MWALCGPVEQFTHGLDILANDLVELGDEAVIEFDKAYDLVKLDEELNVEIPEFRIPNNLSDILNEDISLAIKRLLIEFEDRSV